MLAHEGGAPPRYQQISSGWHALTHMDLDDPSEPRTRSLVQALSRFAPGSLEEALERVTHLLRSHGGDGVPAVCLHQGPMVTVSSALVWLARGEARYLHAEGRLCEHPFVDHSGLLADTATTHR